MTTGKKILLCCAASILAASARPAAAEAPVRIVSISFHGNRTDESVLRNRLPVKEGDALRPWSLAAVRRSLYGLRLFKDVEVSSEAVSGGAGINVRLKDGDYLIPVPMLGGGSGGRRAGLALFSRNLFRKAESLTAAGFSGDNGGSLMFMGALEGWSAQAFYSRGSGEEFHYADGAYTSASMFRKTSDANAVAKFGAVADSYSRTSTRASFALGFPLSPASRDGGLTGRVGWQPGKTAYGDVTAGGSPSGGRDGQVFAELRAGARAGTFADGIGALLGFGLADLGERLKPLPRHVMALGGSLAFYRGDAWTGSDTAYSYAAASGRWSLMWGARNSLQFSAGLSGGRDLPPGRLVATGRELGLQGEYAREFRGQSGAGASVSYSRPLTVSFRGILQGGVFAETAGAWGAGEGGSKRGAGAYLFYRFWRFPLPLGLSYTYSFDDSDSQITGAIGGRF